MPVRSLPPAAKKRKVEQESPFVQKVQQLEDELKNAASSNSSLNPLADLVDLACTAQDPQHTSKAIYALYRTFVIIITKGMLVVASDENAKVVKAWLWDRLNTYVDFLTGLLKDEEKTLRVGDKFMHTLSYLLTRAWLERFLPFKYFSLYRSTFPLPSRNIALLVPHNFTSHISRKSLHHSYSALHLHVLNKGMVRRRRS